MPHERSKTRARSRFAKALRLARVASGLTQEDFGLVSSRTYVSTLERGQNSPTLEKIELLAEAMGIHPATLVILTYVADLSRAERLALMERILGEIDNCMSTPQQQRARPKGR